MRAKRADYGSSEGDRTTNSSTLLQPIQKRLLEWYQVHRRSLAWRDVGDPYAVLVSEFMLQQTQTARVQPKFRAFLARFPTFETLAAATLAEVIRAWAPLGYNRRAVRLHKAARLVMREHGGRLPAEPAALIRIEGIGPYTAGAVACFAFGQQVAVVDTNVRRVLGRLFGHRLGRTAPRARGMTLLAAWALPADRAADWNQALMDLGATVCTAGQPACERCPVAELCTSSSLWNNNLGPGARQAAERPASYATSQRFVGSPRFYRGRIVDHLRGIKDGASVDLGSLGLAVRDDYVALAHEGWLVELLLGLEGDGLVRVERRERYAAGLAEIIGVSLP